MHVKGPCGSRSDEELPLLLAAALASAFFDYSRSAASPWVIRCLADFPGDKFYLVLFSSVFLILPVRLQSVI